MGWETICGKNLRTTPEGVLVVMGVADVRDSNFGAVLPNKEVSMYRASEALFLEDTLFEGRRSRFL